MGEPDELTVDSLSKLANELLNTWAAKTEARIKRRTIDRDLLVYSYAMHAHNLAHAYLKLAELDLWIEAYPVLRTCYEVAVSAQWVFSTKGAPQVVLWEAERNRRNLATSAFEATFLSQEELDELRAKFERQMEEYEEAKKKGLPTTFKGVSDDLGRGAFVYMMYRMLSHYCHAGPGIVDFYVRTDDKGEMIEFGDPNDSEEDHRAALHQLCTALVWSGRAADALGKVTDRRQQLRNAATLLGIPDHLDQSSQAVLRSAKGRYRHN